MTAQGSLNNIIPKPVQLVPTDGWFLWDRRAVLAIDPADRAALAPARRALGECVGWAPEALATLPPPEATGVIRLCLDAKLSGELGEEGYRLNVHREGIDIVAAAPPGAFYAVQTLRQMLPDEAWRAAQQKQSQSAAAWSIPCARIEDRPRFGWRGLMLDSSRYFLPKAFVLRFIDLLALHKMNTFHWHLTDDQGWRLEIRKYPRLTEIGAWRKETLIGHQSHKPQRFDGKPHGGFFTQADVREIVAYAAERSVNVVPEIEMPGHSRAAIAAYPELSSTSRPPGVGTHWGVDEAIVNVEPQTIQFFQDVLAEVIELFPSRFIHVGGDEAKKDQWKANARVQARIGELGLADEDELQAWFTRQMDQFLTANGRRLIGWDEILEGGLAPGATVMSWRGDAGGIAAAQAGHDVVMANNKYTYLDYYQSADKSAEPLAIGGELPLEKVYQFEPIPAALTPDQARHILGGQGQLWTEYCATADYADYMTYPRASALAETLWSPTAGRNFEEFRPRLVEHLKRLDALGVKYRAL